MKIRNHFILLLFSSSLLVSFANAEPSRIVPPKKWLNLLYYEKSGDQFRSRAENLSFFVDRERGPTDPEAELAAEIAFFSQVVPENESHPQCLFPARYEVLRHYADLSPRVRCPKLDEWTENYAPSSIVLVYASQYLANPASAMGHTFLMIPSSVQTRGFWLTYNYAASIPKKTSGVSYVWGGLTGKFMGDYSVMPLYQRLEQYGAIENRDLWLYTIRTSEDEKRLFIFHLWELVHNSHFRYFFKDENCAGILLRTFAAIFEDMDDVNRLDFQVPPIQVVRTLEKKNRIAQFEIIPSQTNTIRIFLDQLSREERQVFYQAISDPENYPEKIDPSHLVTQALLLYLSDQRNRHQGELNASLKSLERKVIYQRTKVTDAPQALRTDSELANAPHRSHPSSQWSLGAISQMDRSPQMEIGYRFTFHSLLDPDAGFLKNSGMELLKLRISVRPDAFRLKQLTIVQIQNFQPYLAFDPHFSWRVSTDLRESLLDPRRASPYSRSSVGYGINRELGHQYAYLFLAADLNMGNSAPESGFELGPEVGGIFSIQSLKIHPSIYLQRGLLWRTPGWHLRSTIDAQWNISNRTFIAAGFRFEKLLSQSVQGRELALRLGNQF